MFQDTAARAGDKGTEIQDNYDVSSEHGHQCNREVQPRHPELWNYQKA
nr:hypothetical protein [Flavobacterium beibuense]